MNALSRWVARGLLSIRWPLLVAAILLGAAAYQSAGKLEFDRSVERMFATDSSVVSDYRRLKETFAGNEIVLAVYEDSDLLAPDGRGVQRLSEVREQVAAVPGVRSILSLDKLRIPVIAPDIVDTKSKPATALREMFEGYTHSADGRVAGLVCILQPRDEINTPRGETIRAMREIIEPLPSGMLTGEPVMIAEGYELVERDGRWLAQASSILLAVTILICLRSVRWVLIPIAVVQWTLLLTRASLVWAGIRLSMVSSMLTAIITVVGVATVVHVAVRVRQSVRGGESPRDALTSAIAWLIVPVFWSCATDAVGFGSLLASHVGPVRDFGLMTGIGAVMVLAAAALFVPSLALVGMRTRGAPVSPEDAETNSSRATLSSFSTHRSVWLRGVERSVQKRWLFLACCTSIFAFGLWGMLRLEIETDFTRNFRRGSRIVESYSFVESRLGGAGVIDVVLPAPASLDWAYVERVLRLEERLRDEVKVTDESGAEVPGVTKSVSLADAVVAASPFDIGAVRSRIARNAATRGGLVMMRANIPAFVDALYGPDRRQPGSPHCFRIMLRARERQPAREKLRLIAQVEAIVDDELRKEDWKPLLEDAAGPFDLPRNNPRRPAVTGYFVLLTNLIASLIEDQWLCFGLASAGVALMMTAAFRSLKLAAIALVPNGLPIFAVMGGMGWLGGVEWFDLKMNMGAAMIAAVSMGLSVDSSIHYMTSYLRERRNGLSPRDAVLATHQTVGAAVILSTLALIVGFAVLVCSQFVPTIYFGVLVSLAMLGGLFGNLLVLPALLLIVEPSR